MTATAAAPPHGIDALVGRAIRDIATSGLVPVAFGGRTDRDGRGIVISHLAGTRTRSLTGLRVGVGLGLGGRALERQRLARVRDYPTATGITDNYATAVAPESLRGVLAVPLLAHGRVRALLYAADRDGHGLSDRVLDLVMSIAGRAERDIAVELGTRSRRAPVTSRPQATMRRRAHELHTELVELSQVVTDEQVLQRLNRAIGHAADLAGVPQPAQPGPLTPREHDVLVLLATGRRNHDIATALGLQPTTVKSYLQSAMRKLGVTNRVEAVYEARRAGLLA